MIGIFKSEAKHRFIANIEINNTIEECYISSSSHLLNMINLKNRKVLLKNNKNYSKRTKYTVQALWENQKILLNLNYVNEIFEHYLKLKYKNHIIKREQIINNYKCDFLNVSINKIYEVKTLLNDKEYITFPNKTSQRCVMQLKCILNILDNYQMQYAFVLLNPNIKKIKIIKNTEFYFLFTEAIKKGMQLSFYSVCWENKDCYINKIKDIPLEYN
ncbi:MAG: hypothetical protein BHW55_02350 [Candidatus Melainabacteria bacterium 35_41]|nr:MAG: hypothetical protein BHW55_02350 [Candidatus Melainabacteria bacterium 35_41]